MKTSTKNYTILNLEQKITNNPAKHAGQLGYILDDVEYKVVTNPKHTMYLVINEKQELFNNLDQIQAAGAGSANQVGTIGSVGCICSTVSTAGSSASVA